MISKEFHPRGHLRTGQMQCNKCGEKLRGEYSECYRCGPVCGKCAYECFNKNIHCRSR